MAGDSLERRKSTRNRGEPPMKLRRTSPNQDVSSVNTPASRRGKEGKTPVKDTPTRSKPGPKPKNRESTRLATASPRLESEEVEKDCPASLDDIRESMERSRHRWLNEGGIFERFWTKPPRKKKGQPAADMPTKAQMNLVEIAQARIIIEPHVFDINLYGIKKPALSWQPPVAGPTKTYNNNTPNVQRPMQNPYPRPAATQSGSSQSLPSTPVAKGVTPNPYALPASNAQTPQTPNNQPSTATDQPVPSKPVTPAPLSGSISTSTTGPAPGNLQAGPSPVQTGEFKTSPAPQSQSGLSQVQNAQAPSSRSATNTSATPSRVQTPQLPASSQATPDPPTQPIAQPAPIQAPAPRAQTARPPPVQPQRQQPQQSVPHPDPVIQMLAQRAAMDPALKELMKLVAAGNTSAEKLAEFQRHITDINNIIAEQKKARDMDGGDGRQQQTKATGAGNRVQQKSQPQQQQQHKAPAFIASKQPAPYPKYEFSNIVFDFVRGGDCYTLPRSSIVQHLPDGMTTLISFIVTRKGNDVPGGNLKSDVEYYQPMTMTVLTVEQKVRDAINTAMLPKDTVSADMKATMARCTLAPRRGLMLGVPEGEDVAQLKKTAVGVGLDSREDAELKTKWDPPNSLLPL